MQEWPPLRSLWLTDKTHVRFARKAVAFSGVTRDTGTDDVLPRGGAATVPWNDVIEVQIVSIKNVPAVLAGILVTLEHVVPGELHFLLRQPIEHEQHDDSRNANLPRDRGDYFVIRRGRGEISPAVEIVSEKVVGVVRRNHVGVAGINQSERATSRADIDRLPQAVEH